LQSIEERIQYVISVDKYPVFGYRENQAEKFSGLNERYKKRLPDEEAASFILI
jgi:hypothetical protein